MNTILTHPDASIYVEESHGSRMISVQPRDGLFTPVREWKTKYPLDLIEHVLRVKGPAYLCNEIMRDEHPLYIEHHFRWDMLSFAEKQNFAGRRLLDFGSGSGASSMVLARLFPDSTIVGVEFVPEFVDLAQHRAQFYGVEDRVSFRLSPDSSSLPPEIGHFDYIIFSAVFEHLFPSERETILPLLWEYLRKGGIMFLDQTPYRWFPIEMHTTGLPLINYLPDSAALYCARKLSKRVHRDTSWPDLLRMGIRGGSTREIISILDRQGKAELLSPSHGVRNDIDLWYQLSSSTRKPVTKKLMKWGFKAFKATTGLTIIPTVSLALRKVA